MRIKVYGNQVKPFFDGWPRRLVENSGYYDSCVCVASYPRLVDIWYLEWGDGGNFALICDDGKDCMDYYWVRAMSDGHGLGVGKRLSGWYTREGGFGAIHARDQPSPLRKVNAASVLKQYIPLNADWAHELLGQHLNRIGWSDNLPIDPALEVRCL